MPPAIRSPDSEPTTAARAQPRVSIRVTFTPSMRDTSWLNAEARILRPTSVWWNSATSSSITTTTEQIVKTANPVSAIVTPPAWKPRSPKGAGKNRKPAWETGRRRARQGVPMELVLNGYSLGTRMLWEALLEQRNNPDLGIDDHVLLIAGQRIWSALDVQNATLVESYRRERSRLQRRDLQRQQSFLDGLVEGRGADPGFASEARDVLGISADDPLACVVAHFDGSLDEPLRAPEDRLERAGVFSYWHVRGGAFFGLVPTSELTLPELVQLLEPAVAGRVGVALSAEGISGFATAYQLAGRVAETLPRGSHQMVSVTDRLPEVLLGGMGG